MDDSDKQASHVSSRDDSQSDVKDCNFIIHFPTCSSFRQILEYLYQSHKTIPLILSEKEISIYKANDDTSIVFDGVFYPYNLTFYYVDPELLKASKEKRYFVHIPTLPLLTYLKSVPKRQRFRLLQKKSKPNFINISFMDSDNISSDIRIDPSTESPGALEVEDPIPIDQPNITMHLSSFYHSTTGSGRISDRSSIISCFPKGVEINGSSAHVASKSQVGFFKEDEEPICEIRVSGDIMKSISKLSSICDEGIVRIYCQNKDYILLQIPISVIGTARIYFINTNRDS